MKESHLRYMCIGFGVAEKEGTLTKIVSFYKDTGVVRTIFESILNEISGETALSEKMYTLYTQQLLISIYRLFMNEMRQTQQYCVKKLDSSIIENTVFKILKFIDRKINDAKLNR